jgi:hypothetical protein
MRERGTRPAIAVVLATLTIAATVARPAAAQPDFRRVGLETTLAVDLFRCPGCDDDTKELLNRPQIVVDVLATIDLGGGWQAYVRPWFRLPHPTTLANPSPPWDKQIYQAAVRYERPGRIATRLETGYIASPVGLGMLDTSPSVNPTIGVHQSYFSPMLPFDVGGGRRVSAISSTYPFGSVLTVSSRNWDARAALVNSAPTRINAINGASNPRATPVFEAGGGVTPAPGLRVGASFARGRILTDEEVPIVAIPGDREVTMLGVEGEYAFRYTKLSGEFVRDAFTLPGRSDTAYTWFIQGRQTLSPRWFTAGRYEGTSAPVAATGVFFAGQPDLVIGEATVGFRATHEVTLRGSYYARKAYGRQDFDHQAAVSAVWYRRWW